MTRCDQVWPMWPDYREIIIIKAIIFEVLDVNRYYCDHLWPDVTRWQSFQVGTKIFNHFTTAGPFDGFPILFFSYAPDMDPSGMQSFSFVQYVKPSSILICRSGEPCYKIVRHSFAYYGRQTTARGGMDYRRLACSFLRRVVLSNIAHISKPAPNPNLCRRL